jgi:hypothetical protein
LSIDRRQRGRAEPRDYSAAMRRTVPRYVLLAAVLFAPVLAATTRHRPRLACDPARGQAVDASDIRICFASATSRERRRECPWRAFGLHDEATTRRHDGKSAAD